MVKSNKKKVRKPDKHKSTKVTLGRYHISNFVWLLCEKLSKDLERLGQIKNINKILKKTRVLKSEVLYPLNEDISLLEPLMSCYLADRDGSPDHGFNIGDGQLYKSLVGVRRFIKEFPPNIERFYKQHQASEKRYQRKTPICRICKKRGANRFFSNAKVHTHCLVKVGAKYCEYCASLYLSGVTTCSIEPGCRDYKLKKAAKKTNKEHSGISVQVSQKTLKKLKAKYKGRKSVYRGGDHK